MTIKAKPTASAQREAAFIAAAPDAKKPVRRPHAPVRRSPRAQVTFTVPIVVLDKFNDLCEARGVSRSAALVLLMTRAIENGL